MDCECFERVAELHTSLDLSQVKRCHHSGLVGRRQIEGARYFRSVRYRTVKFFPVPTLSLLPRKSVQAANYLPKGIPMNEAVEQITTTANDNLLGLRELTTKVQANVEKLIDLNMATSKTALGESFAHAKAVLSVRDAQELVALQSDFVKPMVEKSSAYAQDFQRIIAEASADFAEAARANMADVQRGFSSLMEYATKNVPQGTESAVSFFNQSVNAGQNAFRTAQTDAQQAVDTVQSNITSASKQAVDNVKKATKAA